MKAKENLKAWVLLAEIQKNNNLTEATRSLEIDKSTASKLLHQLEKELGFSLLDRTKKPAVLTWNAKKLIPHVHRLIANWNFVVNFHATSGETSHKNFNDEIIVSFPLNSDGSKSIDYLTEYSKKINNLTLQFTSDCGETGLLNGTADIAWFGYRPKSEGIFWIPAGFQLTCLFASRKYIERYGEPKSIYELSGHTLLMRERSNGSFFPILENGQETLDISNFPKIFYGNANVCKRKLIQGEGISIDVSISIIEDYLKSGEVIPVLRGWHRSAWPISLACRKENKDEKNIREIMTAIKNHFSEHSTDNWFYWYERLNLPIESIPSIYLPAFLSKDR